jgi:hypothetical protein
MWSSRSGADRWPFARGELDRYNVGRLIAQHGDAKLTELLAKLTDCPKFRSVGIHEQCKAAYERLDV